MENQNRKRKMDWSGSLASARSHLAQESGDWETAENSVAAMTSGIFEDDQSDSEEIFIMERETREAAPGVEATMTEFQETASGSGDANLQENMGASILDEDAIVIYQDEEPSLARRQNDDLVVKKRQVLRDITHEYCSEPQEGESVHIENSGYEELSSQIGKNFEDGGYHDHWFQRSKSSANLFHRWKWSASNQPSSEALEGAAAEDLGHALNNSWNPFRSASSKVVDKENSPDRDAGHNRRLYRFSSSKAETRSGEQNPGGFWRRWRVSGPLEVNEGETGAETTENGGADADATPDDEDKGGTSVRSFQNLKKRFESLIADYHQNTGETAVHPENHAHSPLRELKSLFNRSELQRELEQKPKSFGSLKVVNNRLKRSVQRTHSGNDSLEAMCESENLSKVEVLKRMKDGSIKLRGGSSC